MAAACGGVAIKLLSMGLSRTVTIVNRKGLHARPAASFVKLASKFDSKIRIQDGEKDVDGKSIMGMMMLAASQGTQIIINAEGNDEQQAVEELSSLVNQGFNE
ncbi:MAG TPA: HPr family phosphocarrier protein [Gammaproteobacteria bacterium]|jgi:phosphocarrier protein